VSNLRYVRLALLLLALALGPALAEEQYGAIAYSQVNGKYGYSYNYGDPEEADRIALAECVKRAPTGCEVVLSFHNGCGALARGERNGYGAAWARTAESALDGALSGCQRGERGCRVVETICTGQQRKAANPPAKTAAVEVAPAEPDRVADLFGGFDRFLASQQRDWWQPLVGPGIGLLIAFLFLRALLRRLREAIPAALRQQIAQAARTAQARQRQSPAAGRRQAPPSKPVRVVNSPIQDHNLVRRYMRTRIIVR